MEDAADFGSGVLRNIRSRYPASVVERCWRASEPYIPRASRPHHRHALLASDGARGAGWRRRSLWRYLRRYESFVCGLSAVEGADSSCSGAWGTAAPAVDTADEATGGSGILCEERVGQIRLEFEANRWDYWPGRPKGSCGGYVIALLILWQVDGSRGKANTCSRRRR